MQESPLSKQQERELISKAQQGDETAFDLLVRCYHSRIYQLCLKMTRDTEIAKDLTQESFLHAFQHVQSFQRKSSFYTWVYKIARNGTLNYLRGKKGQELEFKEEIFNDTRPQKNEDKPIDESLLLIVEELPLLHRTVVELYEIQKLSQKEIAAQLDIPLGTVRSRLYYARRKMRQKMKNRLKNTAG